MQWPTTLHKEPTTSRHHYIRGFLENKSDMYGTTCITRFEECCTLCCDFWAYASETQMPGYDHTFKQQCWQGLSVKSFLRFLKEFWGTPGAALWICISILGVVTWRLSKAITNSQSVSWSDLRSDLRSDSWRCLGSTDKSFLAWHVLQYLWEKVIISAWDRGAHSLRQCRRETFGQLKMAKRQCSGIFRGIFWGFFVPFVLEFKAFRDNSFCRGATLSLSFLVTPFLRASCLRFGVISSQEESARGQGQCYVNLVNPPCKVLAKGGWK